MADFDPYDILGIPRTASQDDIKSAFRYWAKATHPDKGGDPEAFHRVNRAYEILGDPERRRRYDETGAIDDEQPEGQRRAAALGLINQFLANLITDFRDKPSEVKQTHFGGFSAMEIEVKTDPRHQHDLILKMIAVFEDNIRRAKADIAKAKDNRVYLLDFIRRWRSADGARPIEEMFEAQVKRIEGNIQGVERNIAALEEAIKIVSGYEFDAESIMDNFPVEA